MVYQLKNYIKLFREDCCPCFRSGNSWISLEAAKIDILPRNAIGMRTISLKFRKKIKNSYLLV